MDIKKYTQAEVNGILWKACDTFRGKIDSSVYKDYILVMLFIKYVSDICKEHKEALMEKYEGDIEMVNRQMSYERFVLDEISTFDYIYDKRNQADRHFCRNTVNSCGVKRDIITFWLYDIILIFY